MFRHLAISLLLLISLTVPPGAAEWGSTGCRSGSAGGAGRTLLQGWHDAGDGWQTYYSQGVPRARYNDAEKIFEEGGVRKPRPWPWEKADNFGIGANDCKCSKGCICKQCECAKQGKPCTDDCKCVPEAKIETVVPNFGIDLAQMATDGREHVTVNGRPIAAGDGLRLIGGKDLPQDADLLRLTVIGPESERQRVVQDLQSAPELARLKGRLVVQDYGPDHWAVARAGFATSGHPTVYLQAPDGKVLHRQDDYRGAAQLAEAIRKADPTYDPKTDPDLNKSSLFTAIPLWGWLAVVGVVLLILPGKTSQ